MLSRVDGDSTAEDGLAPAANPNPGIFDATNTGLSLDGAFDLEAGPDGTIFSTQNVAPNWLIGWTDRGRN